MDVLRYISLVLSVTFARTPSPKMTSFINNPPEINIAVLLPLPD